MANPSLNELFAMLSQGWDESQQRMAKLLMATHILFLMEVMEAVEKKGL